MSDFPPPGLPNPLKIVEAIEAFQDIRPVLSKYGINVGDLNIWSLPFLWSDLKAVLGKHGFDVSKISL